MCQAEAGMPILLTMGSSRVPTLGGFHALPGADMHKPAAINGVVGAIPERERE